METLKIFEWLFTERLKERGIVMPCQNEASIFMAEDSDAAIVLFDVPEVRVIQSQQSTNHYFVHHAV